MKIYCSCCNKVQPVKIDNCRDAKTNEPFQDIVCAECDLVIATGTDISQPEQKPLADRELMQQALEALNRSDYLGWQLNIPIIKALREKLAQPEQEPIDSDEKAGAYMDARLWEFIDMAAAWPEAKPDSRTWDHVLVYAPKQPVQEPVAWGVFDGPNLHDVNFTEEEAQEMMRLKGDGSVVKPLYTSPQPQMQPCAGRNCGSTNPNLHSAECFEDYEKATEMNQWQELTDEELRAAYMTVSGNEWCLGGMSNAETFYEAIEAKLREKNA